MPTSELTRVFTGLTASVWELITRDFSRSKYFGVGDLLRIPLEDFVTFEPLEVKNQRTSDLCGACALCSEVEGQSNVPLSIEYSFSRIKKIMGNWKKRGADPRSICKAGISCGFLKSSDSPFTLEKDGRDVVANPDSWNSAYDLLAGWRQKAFFKVDGHREVFDSIRDVLYEYFSKQLRKGVLVGITWHSAWTSSPGGVIPVVHKESVTYDHMVRAFGQRVIDGKTYLCLQDSRGKDRGDRGRYYFPREHGKKIRWASCFEDVDPALVKSQSWDWKQVVYNSIVSLLKQGRKC